MATLSPLIGALSLLTLLRSNASSTRPIVISNTLLTLILSLATVICYEPNLRDKQDRLIVSQMVLGLPWLTTPRDHNSDSPNTISSPQSGQTQENPKPKTANDSTLAPLSFRVGFDINFSFGADGLSIWSVLAISMGVLLAIVFSDEHRGDRFNEYSLAILVAQTGLIASLTSRDALVSLLAFECAMIPLFILIGEFGNSSRRETASKFLAYQWTGGALILTAMTMFAASGPWMQSDLVPRRSGISFDSFVIAERLQGLLSRSEVAVRLWQEISPCCATLLMIGVSIRLSLFPFHSWMRETLTCVPSGLGSLLAIALPQTAFCTWLKLGTPLFAADVASFSMPLGILGLFGLAYAGMLAFRTKEIHDFGALLPSFWLVFAALSLRIPSREGTCSAFLITQTQGLLSAALLLVGQIPTRAKTAATELNTISNQSKQSHQRFKEIAILPAAGAMAWIAATGPLLNLSVLATEELLLAISAISILSIVMWRFIEVLILKANRSENCPDFSASQSILFIVLLLLLAMVTMFPSWMLSKSEPSFGHILHRIERLSN